jgi:hypothetical protein
MIAAVQAANDHLSQENFSFAYFDLGLAAYEWEMLQRLEIIEHNTLGLPSDAPSFQLDVIAFIQALSSRGSNDGIAQKVANITANIVHHIMDASAFQTASVLMVAGVSPATYDPAILEMYCFDIIDWHVDKTLQEISDSFYQDSASQLTYLFTLKGSSTLYYRTNEAFQQHFLANMEEGPLSFGCSFNKDCGVDVMLDPKRISTAERGKGSVHLAGKSTGTIHAAPLPHERLVIILIPEAVEVINRYYNTDLTLV